MYNGVAAAAVLSAIKEYQPYHTSTLVVVTAVQGALRALYSEWSCEEQAHALVAAGEWFGRRCGEALEYAHKHKHVVSTGSAST